LGKRERELDSISEELLAADGRGLDARFRDIEKFVQKRLQDIRGLLFAHVPDILLPIQKSFELLANYGCFAPEIGDKCGIPTNQKG